MSTAAGLPPVRGGCLCGRVRYELHATHREGYYCHCRMCQLAFGNTRAAFINVRKDQFGWLGALPAIHASSRFARRGFCAGCGTPLTFTYLDSENIDISVGSLDDPAAFLPGSHFAIESRLAHWDPDDALPGQRLDEHPVIRQRWTAAYGDAVQPGVEAGRAEPPG